MICDKHLKKSVSDFRTARYRVFYASPYFCIDLPYEIKWHKMHLKKLHRQAANPKLCHKVITSGSVDGLGGLEEVHYEAKVLNSIPLHQKLLADHIKRLETMLDILPKRTYNKIKNYSIKHGGIPEFFVYDKRKRDFFFIAETTDALKKAWVHNIKDRMKLCDVVVLGN